VPDRKMTNEEWDTHVRRLSEHADLPAELVETMLLVPQSADVIRERRPKDSICPLCKEPVLGEASMDPLWVDGVPRPVHWQCMLRSVLGGIGHLIAHDHWCGAPRHDPDAGLTYRQSSLLAAEWQRVVGSFRE
jgi:hypothetical protein